MHGTTASFRRVAALAVVVAAAYLGCTSNDADPITDTSVTSTTVTGAGAGSPCNFGAPDGFCVPSGPAAEGCDCPDCATAAVCTGDCSDNGVCENGDGQSEDCSCDDCFYKVPGCSPSSGDCDGEDPSCQAGEACTCPDCTNTPFCTDNCVDNGVCVEIFEGCSCADCGCNGGTTTTTAGSGGSGGSASSTGGASATSGSGGAGGAGGA